MPDSEGVAGIPTTGYRELVDTDPRDFADDPDAPWPVKRGGWILRLYEHSRGLAFGGLGGSAIFGSARTSGYWPSYISRSSSTNRARNDFAGMPWSFQFGWIKRAALP